MLLIEQLREEHKVTHEAFEMLSDTLRKIEDGDKEEKIERGSRVTILFDNSTSQDGRVVFIKPDGILQISRDGYKGLINISPDKVVHLSVGSYGKMEKKKWLLEQRLKEIEDELTTLGQGIEKARQVIQSQAFFDWYKDSGLVKNLPYNSLLQGDAVFIIAAASEFLKVLKANFLSRNFPS